VSGGAHIPQMFLRLGTGLARESTTTGTPTPESNEWRMGDFPNHTGTASAKDNCG
jgi:hypothetical protein